MTRWERSGFRKCITSTHVLLLSAITRWNDIIFRENLLKLEVYFKTLNFEVVKTEAAITVKTETRWQRTTISKLKCYEPVRRCFRSSPTSEVSSGCGWVCRWWPCSSRSSSSSTSSFWRQDARADATTTEWKRWNIPSEWTKLPSARASCLRILLDIAHAMHLVFWSFSNTHDSLV